MRNCRLGYPRNMRLVKVEPFSEVSAITTHSAAWLMAQHADAVMVSGVGAESERR